MLMNYNGINLNSKDAEVLKVLEDIIKKPIPKFNDYMGWMNCYFIVNNRVEKLSLKSEKIINFPEIIGQLDALKTLSIQKCHLKKLPEAISNLKNLKELVLSSNDITNLPDWIGNFTKLTILNISKNKFSYLPDSIGNCTNLINLDISNNRFSYLPNSIGNCIKLKNFNISNNQITDLTESISNLINLEYFSMNNNSLKNLPNYIGKFNKLKTLNIHYNKLSTLPESIGSLSNLEFIHAHGNQITELPERIKDLNKLEYLYLHDNKFSELPQAITNLTNLKELDLHNNLILNHPPFLSNWIKELKKKLCKVKIDNPSIRKKEIELEKKKAQIDVNSSESDISFSNINKDDSEEKEKVNNTPKISKEEIKEINTNYWEKMSDLIAKVDNLPEIEKTHKEKITKAYSEALSKVDPSEYDTIRINDLEPLSQEDINSYNQSVIEFNINLENLKEDLLAILEEWMQKNPEGWLIINNYIWKLVENNYQGLDFLKESHSMIKVDKLSNLLKDYAKKYNNEKIQCYVMDIHACQMVESNDKRAWRIAKGIFEKIKSINPEYYSKDVYESLKLKLNLEKIKNSPKTPSKYFKPLFHLLEIKPLIEPSTKEKIEQLEVKIGKKLPLAFKEFHWYFDLGINSEVDTEEELLEYVTYRSTKITKSSLIRRLDSMSNLEFDLREIKSYHTDITAVYDPVGDATFYVHDFDNDDPPVYDYSKKVCESFSNFIHIFFLMDLSAKFRSKVELKYQISQEDINKLKSLFDNHYYYQYYKDSDYYFLKDQTWLKIKITIYSDKNQRTLIYIYSKYQEQYYKKIKEIISILPYFNDHL